MDNGEMSPLLMEDNDSIWSYSKQQKILMTTLNSTWMWMIFSVHQDSYWISYIEFLLGKGCFNFFYFCKVCNTCSEGIMSFSGCTTKKFPFHSGCTLKKKSWAKVALRIGPSSYCMVENKIVLREWIYLNHSTCFIYLFFFPVN